MRIIKVAKEMAMNNGHIFHLAALLWRRGKLIRIGVNSSRSHSSQLRHYDSHSDNSRHAENDALAYAKPGDYLEVIRWRADGSIACAKPCRHCEIRIKRLGVRVRYTNYLGEWEYE